LQKKFLHEPFAYLTRVWTKFREQQDL